MSTLPSLDVSLPVAATNSGGTVIADAGVHSLTGAQLASILGSRNHQISAADEYGADVAVWQAIAGAIGDGLPTPISLPAEPSTAETGNAEPGGATGSSGDFFARVTAGPLSVRSLPFDPIVSVDVNPRGVDAVVLDRVEIALVFGHVAPTRVAAPYAGYSYRVVSHFNDDQLPNWRGYDVAYAAVEALFDIEGNVRSVDAGPGDAPDRTIVEVANESLVPASQGLASVFGAIDVRVADTRIAGIDFTVTLGLDYLATLDTAASAASVPDTGAAGATTDATVPAEDTTVEGTT
jgi:hypothetical protein